MSVRNASADRLLAAHHELDAACRNRGGRLFISDSYCEHPFVRDVLPGVELARASDADLLAYCFHNDRADIFQSIRRFHEIRDKRIYDREHVYVAAGLTSLISAQMLMLRRRGVGRLYYTRPAYYTYYFLADLLDIEMVPLNEDLLDDASARLDLPDEPEATLLVTDPIWHLGRRIDAHHWEEVRTWQAATRALIFVDGAFQYLNWRDRGATEPSANLEPELTIRSLCPTKTVAVHGPRFAYSLLPAAMWEDLRYCYAASAGSSSVFDHLSAMAIMRYLTDEPSNAQLLELMQRRFERLIQVGAFTTPVQPSVSYFCFVRPAVPAKRLLTMDQTFFDSAGYDGLVRFNLLLPEETLRPYVAAASGDDAAAWALARTDGSPPLNSGDDAL